MAGAPHFWPFIVVDTQQRPVTLRPEDDLPAQPSTSVLGR